MSTVYYSADDSSENDDCVVTIENKTILLEYEDDGRVQYCGQEIGEGHFSLACRERSGKASLHMFEGSEILEGSWVESGNRGMWKIKLA